MAENQSGNQSGSATPQIVVAMPDPMQQRQRLAAQMRALRQNPPDRTVRGGRYINAKGQLVNAQGKQIEGASEPGQTPGVAPAVSTEGGTSGTSGTSGSTPGGTTGTLPEDFPQREALVAGGFDSLAKVRAASDQELLDLDGIGPASLIKIRSAAVSAGSIE